MQHLDMIALVIAALALLIFALGYFLERYNVWVNQAPDRIRARRRSRDARRGYFYS